MNQKRALKNATLLAGLAVLAASTAACNAIRSGAAQVGGLQSTGDGPQESISVSGFGDATGVPDIATVQLAVEIKAPTIGEGLELSNQTVEQVMQALIGMGIAERDLQTTGFNVWPEDLWDNQTGQPTGERVYHVDSTLTVKVREIEQVSETIQTGLDAGATNIWGLTFGIDDTSALEAEARMKALEDARDRAQQLAGALDLTLGEPMVVSELAGGGIFQFGGIAAAREMGGGGGPPVAPGELTVTIQVDVMYAIERASR